MSRYSIPLTANIPQRLPYPGKLLQVIDLGGVASVDVLIEWGGDRQDTDVIGGVGEKFKLFASDRIFTALTLTSSITTTVDVMIAYYDVTFNPAEGVSVTATIDASQLPLPVLVGNTAASAVPVTINAFVPGGNRTDVAATTANQQSTMNGAGTNIRVTNETDQSALVKFGTAGVDATSANSQVVMAQSERIFNFPAGSTTAAVALRSGTGTVSLQLGTGV